MRICRIAFIGLLVLVICTPVFAADVVKLGFFDMQSIIDRSEMGKEGAQKFEVEMRKVREKLAAELEQLQKLEDEYKKKEHIWSENVKKAKYEEYARKRAEYERLRREGDLQLGRLQQSTLTPLRDKVVSIVFQIGKEGGYTMILEMQRAGLVYAPDSLDLTDRIIRELNEIAAKEAGGKQ